MVHRELNRESLVNFKIRKTRESRILWINPKTPDRSPEYRKKFLEEFSYCNDESRCFTDIQFDTEYTKEVTAEIYGGAGRGGNFGGVRCGNYTHFQVKGIGVNPLLNPTASIFQSNGIYSIHEAIRETLFSILGNAILPLGCVNIQGIIYIGRSSHSAMTEFPTLPLCLAVRDKVIR